MPVSAFRDEINKRFTLNWLIQGAAQHAGMTAHHLVRDELDAIDPRLVPLYDEYALINLLQYWSLDASLLLGSPTRFWKRAASDPKHLFFGHPVLSRHGGMLAAVSRQKGCDRCAEKRLWGLRFCFPYRVLFVTSSLRRREARHKQALIELSKKAVTMVWGIPPHRLDGDLTAEVAFGTV
ncbi:hypothetical protein ACYOEI_31025, partial [Singulisphaera rosea]